MAFTVTQPGEYRFDVRPESDETSVQVRRGERLDLFPRALERVRVGHRIVREEFQSDFAAQARILSLEDHPHAPAANPLQNLVVRNRRPYQV